VPEVVAPSSAEEDAAPARGACSLGVKGGRTPPRLQCNSVGMAAAGRGCGGGERRLAWPRRCSVLICGYEIAAAFADEVHLAGATAGPTTDAQVRPPCLTEPSPWGDQLATHLVYTSTFAEPDRCQRASARLNTLFLAPAASEITTIVHKNIYTTAYTKSNGHNTTAASNFQRNVR
jgi:hypothetical protein